MATLANAAQNFIDTKGSYVDQAYQNITKLPIQNQWVGFLDGLSEMESGGAGGYGASNGTFVGMYQFGDALLTGMHFYTGIGGKLLGVTNLAQYSENPIAQDLSALIEFSGFNNGSVSDTYQSVYKQVESTFIGIKGARLKLISGKAATSATIFPLCPSRPQTSNWIIIAPAG